MKIPLSSLSILVMVFAFATTSMAQNTQQSKDRLAEIRRIYNEAQANAKRSADNMVSVTQREKSDGHTSIVTQDFFYTVGIVEGLEIPYYKLNLLRRTVKGTIDTYEEFLFDDEESLVFYFYSGEEEKGVKVETRWYAGAADDGTALTVKKFTDTKTSKDVTSRYADRLGMPWDEGFLHRYANDMQEAFNHITLRGWD
ncbi:MAG: hypothetical protein IKH02_11325 [Prevotella sp.]|nr:hypothetical protein [Prevotella sp.]